MTKTPQNRRNWSDATPWSLAGKTVLLTRPREQSEEISARLQMMGAAVIHCPTIEIVPPADWTPLDASIGRLNDYDWIIFTSANGVRFFFSRLRETTSGGITDGRLICAIGPATSLALENAGAPPHLVAADSKAEGALASIVEYTGGSAAVAGLRFLIPRARVAREVLPEGLRKLGAIVDTVEAYQSIKPDIQPGSILRLFTEHSIDVVTFTSSSTVANFAALAGLTNLSTLLGDALVACIGPVTAETAVSYGLGNIIQPEQYNADALVEALARSVKGNKTPEPGAPK